MCGCVCGGIVVGVIEKVCVGCWCGVGCWCDDVDVDDGFDGDEVLIYYVGGVWICCVCVKWLCGGEMYWAWGYGDVVFYVFDGVVYGV